MSDTASIISQVTEYTAIAQNVILALSGVAAAIIAYLGLTTWRKELKGKSEYSKAKEVLKAAYKVRLAFALVRDPIIFRYEYPEEMTDVDGHLKREKDYEGTSHVYETRWKFLAESFQELEEQNLDAQVEWGSDFQEVIVPLRKCKVELQIAIQNMLSAKKNPYEQRSSSANKRADEQSTLYHIGEDSKHDQFTPRINEAISLFEKRLRPHIKK